MSETGSIKFVCEHERIALPEFEGFAELNACRRKLQQLRMLGVDGSGIGFGNLSVRDRGTSSFYITGSGTGALPVLSLDHHARVTAYDFAVNWIACEGMTIASAESLTHAAVYKSDHSVGAVIHGHSSDLWTRLAGQVPTTPAEVEYGTPAMAYAVQQLFYETDVRARKIFIMGGHPDGFITFGADLEGAFTVLMRELPRDL